MFSRFQQLAKFELDAAGDRDGSDFYFAGQVTHSRDGNFVGTYDTKIDLSGACNFFLHRVSLIGPTLDLTGGNDPNGDPDSLNFSFKWELPLTGQGYPHKLGTVRLINKATLESTQDFAQRDFIYDGDIRGVLRPWFLSADGKVRAHFYPDFGIEMGKNLRGILPAIDGNNIVRPKIGASFFFIFDAAKVGLKDISLDTSYARRWPLIDEVTFKKDDNGGFTGIDVGTHPRDHVKQSMNIDITKYLGFVISYEYGSEPPKYKFLDSKFTLGLNIKAAFK
ncbi:MAG TPA: hypothetical protein VN872_09570 [Candidatus Acidoferrum sp.]|nr:hypothetical protein [Candidatus Acidoferrum sp.]